MTYLLLVFLLSSLMLLNSAVHLMCPRQIPTNLHVGYYKPEDTCVTYDFNVSSTGSKTMAEEYCKEVYRRQQARLLRVNDYEHFKQFKSHYLETTKDNTSQKTKIWLDLTLTERNWKWGNGGKVSFTDWHIAENKTEFGGGNCALLELMKEIIWISVSCGYTSEYLRIVCEIPNYSRENSSLEFEDKRSIGEAELNGINDETEESSSILAFALSGFALCIVLMTIALVVYKKGSSETMRWEDDDDETATQVSISRSFGQTYF